MTLRKGYADTAGGQVHYRFGDGEGRPAVFLHQTASSSKMWSALMERIPSRPTYALDTPGFGGSFDPEGLPSLGQYASWLMEAIDALELDEIDLVGHHTGACLGVEIAAGHPDRIRSLAMIGPVPLTQEERDEFRVSFGTPISPSADGAYLLETWQYLAGLGADSDIELHHREVVDTLRAYYGRFQTYSAVWDQDFVSFFEQVRCPMLLMCAPDDVLMPFFERACELRPDAETAMLAGANFQPDQDTDGTLEALLEFWSG